MYSPGDVRLWGLELGANQCESRVWISRSGRICRRSRLSTERHVTTHLPQSMLDRFTDNMTQVQRGSG